MFLRITGSAVLLVSAIFAIVAIFGLSRSSEMAQMMSAASKSTPQTIEADDWQRHWRVSSGLMLAVSAAGCAAGLGLIWRRRWGLALLAAAVSVNLAVDATLQLGGGPKYRFEVAEPGELAAFAILALALWFGYWKMRHHGPTPRPAP
jgi:purine-cytosine permease-like protein